MELRALGGLEWRGGHFTRRKSLLLLCHLALEGPRSRHDLARLFFDQAEDPASSLRTTLKRVRRELPGALEGDADPVRVRVRCDAQLLTLHLNAGLWNDAVSLYAGAFLADVTVSDLHEELVGWALATRERLAARVRLALLALAEDEARRGALRAAAALTERAAWLPGAPEPDAALFRRVAVLLHAGGSPQAERWRARAAERRVDLNAEALGVPLARRPSIPALPVRGTAFVGRTVERAQLLDALARPEVRLLTLVGPGGIGKTRLALMAARDQQARQAVAFVPLEELGAPADVPAAVAAALDAVLPPGVPPLDALAAHLGGAPLLLVLDGAERLVTDMQTVLSLLRRCPALTVLVTSRERLSLPGEWVLSVDGLTVPSTTASVEEALRTEAVQLFTRRASRADLTFTLTPDNLAAVQAICALVGGSPLALELAAAWARLMPCTDIEAEVRRSLDFLQVTGAAGSARHASVRAVFQQGWVRLSSKEQRVLSRLSVFQGAFSREAAQRVSGDDGAALDALERQSLLRVTSGGQFDLHVLIRQFVRERLAEDPGELRAATAAHVAYVQGAWRAQHGGS